MNTETNLGQQPAQQPNDLERAMDNFTASEALRPNSKRTSGSVDMDQN